MTELLEHTTLPQDNQPELARTVKIMERLHASEVFATPEQSKEFLNSLDYAEFKTFLSLVNGVERGIPTPERGKVSNSVVQTEGVLWGTTVEYRPPHESLRDDLLKMAFEKSQSVESPEMAGLTLGLSINAIHYFADGNGRTARMTYALLSRGYDGSPETQEYYSALLENTKGRDVINPNPAVSGIDKTIRGEMFEIAKTKYCYTDAFGDKMPAYLLGGYGDACAGTESPEELVVSDDIDAVARQELFNTLESGGMTIISLMTAFSPDRVKDFVRTSTDGKRTFIDGDAFLPTLTSGEISKWWNNSERTIQSYVRRLINVVDRQDASAVAAHYDDAMLQAA